MVEINLNVYFSDYDKLQIFSTCHVLFIFLNFCLWLHHNLFAFACFFFLGRLFFRIRNIRIFGFCWVGRRCRHLRRRLVIFLGWMNRIWWRLIMKVFLKLYEICGQFEYREASFTKWKALECLLYLKYFDLLLGPIFIGQWYYRTALIIMGLLFLTRNSGNNAIITYW